MTTVPPEPLVPSEIDLRDFPDFPLDFRRLYASDTWIACDAEEKIAALRLWTMSMHQEPAGSLPNHDRILSDLAGYGVAIDAFKRVKVNAMRGWELHSDGRLYHPVVAEKMINCWEKKKRKGTTNTADRERKRRKREAARATQMSGRTITDSPSDTNDSSGGHSASVQQDTPPDTPTLSGAVSAGSPPGKALKEKGREETDDVTTRARLDGFGKVYAELEEILNWANPFDGSRIHAWLKAGADPELDIYPTVKRLMAGAGDKRISSLRYFDNAIAEAVKARTSGLELPPFLDARNRTNGHGRPTLRRAPIAELRPLLEAEATKLGVPELTPRARREFLTARGIDPNA